MLRGGGIELPGLMRIDRLRLGKRVNLCASALRGDDRSVGFAWIGPIVAPRMGRLDLCEAAKDAGGNVGAVVPRGRSHGRIRRGRGRLRPDDRRVLEQARRIFRRRGRLFGQRGDRGEDAECALDAKETAGHLRRGSAWFRKRLADFRPIKVASWLAPSARSEIRGRHTYTDVK